MSLRNLRKATTLALLGALLGTSVAASAVASPVAGGTTAAVGLPAVPIGSVDSGDWPCPYEARNYVTCVGFSGFKKNDTTYWNQSKCRYQGDANYPLTAVNCTNYVAYRLKKLGAADFVSGECKVGTDAGSWARRAAACGVTVNTTPKPLSVLQFDHYAKSPVTGNSYDSGHVAFIDDVIGDWVYVSEAQCYTQASKRYKIKKSALAAHIAASGGKIHVLHPALKNVNGGTGHPTTSGSTTTNAVQWMIDNDITSTSSVSSFDAGADLSRNAAVAFMYKVAGSPSVALPSGSPFTDVPVGSTYYKPIVWAEQEGIVNGFGDGTFRGSNPVTRGAVAAMLQRLSGDSLPASCPFTFGDVPSTHKFLRHICWLSQADITSAGSGDNFAPDRNTTRGEMAIFLYRLNYWRFSDVGMVDNGYEAVAWMQREGITTIPEGGKFGGENSIKREALAAFLYRAAGKPAFTPPANSPFPDLEPGDDFYKEITWAWSQGIFNGTSSGLFDPEGTLTRAQVALVLRRYTGDPAIENCPVQYADVNSSTSHASSICWMGVNQITTVVNEGNFMPNDVATRLDVAIWLYRMNQKSLL